MFVAETLNELLHNGAHWQFEAIGWVIDNVIIGLLVIKLGGKWLRAHDLKKHGHKHCPDVHEEERTFIIDNNAPIVIKGPKELLDQIYHITLESAQ